ncbi:MAG TPA: TonB-dependent receptor [Xanthobacteraceae bacterium]|nr:TonB-dependent receptor [Xanthobacteraceae bacterium]
MIVTPPITVTTEKPKPKRRTTQAPKVAAKPGPTQPSAQPAFNQPDAGEAATGIDLSSAPAALPAASTHINQATIANRPYVSYGDLFRPTTGFDVSNYGQNIGYGLAMRGYTEDEHGRDISYLYDGVPLNEISSIHTPNYADLNILLPESIRSIDIVRGPFSVLCGDSNLGGCVIIATKTAEPFASVGASGGSYGTIRGIATYSNTGGPVPSSTMPLKAAPSAASSGLPYETWFGEELDHSDGYRDNSRVNHYNSFNKITMPLLDGGYWSLRAQAYGSNFGAPGYIEKDLVSSGALSPKAATDPTDGGDKYQENLVANYSSGAQEQELTGVLFADHNVFDRYSNFSSVVCTVQPCAGQSWQHDEREMVGGRLQKVWTGAVGGDLPVQVLAGTSWRTDFIDTFSAPTVGRAQTGADTTDLGITETNWSAYGQVQAKPIEWLKLTGAMRYDQFFYDITNRINPALEPNISPGVWSPKAGVSITPASWVELYANYGQGFRSPDAATELLSNPALQPFKIQSEEGGIKFRFDRVLFSADVWTTDSQNEAFQPAPGLPTTFLGKARRDGFDLDGRAYVVKDAFGSVAVFANYGAVQALLLDAAPSQYVPDVPTYAANVGVDFDVSTLNGQRFSGEAYVSFIGTKYMTQDGLITTSPYTRLAGHLAYSWPQGWTSFVQAIWYPSSQLDEIAFNLNGPVTGAVSSNIYTSPVAKLTVLGGFSYKFPTTVAELLQPTTRMVVK